MRTHARELQKKKRENKRQRTAHSREAGSFSRVLLVQFIYRLVYNIICLRTEAIGNTQERSCLWPAIDNSSFLFYLGVFDPCYFESYYLSHDTAQFVCS